MWSKLQQATLDLVKKLISNAPILAYYNEDLTLKNDASEYGLGVNPDTKREPFYICKSFTVGHTMT